jgi:hypothetical protein
MRNRSIVGLLAVVGLITAFAVRPSGAASTRSKMTCEAFRADVESTTKRLGMPAVVYKAGDWGNTPGPLRVLPPKASFCGSWNMSAAIASPLTGKELVAYYTPILEKMGCKEVKCEITEKKTHCSCGLKDGFARIGTEERSEVYQISFMSFSKGSH